MYNLRPTSEGENPAFITLPLEKERKISHDLVDNQPLDLQPVGEDSEASSPLQLPGNKGQLQIILPKMDIPEGKLKDGSPASTSSKEPDEIENQNFVLLDIPSRKRPSGIRPNSFKTFDRGLTVGTPLGLQSQKNNVSSGGSKLKGNSGDQLDQLAVSTLSGLSPIKRALMAERLRKDSEISINSSNVSTPLQDNRLGSIIRQERKNSVSSRSSFHERMSAVKMKWNENSLFQPQAGAEESCSSDDSQESHSSIKSPTGSVNNSFSEKPQKSSSRSSAMRQQMRAIRHSSKKVLAQHALDKLASFESQYFLGEKLGEGQHSSVFKCFHIEDEKKLRPLAVKITREDDEEKKEASRKEYELTKDLDHRGIPRSLAKFENETTGEISMVMELAEGTDLQSLLDSPTHTFTDQEIKSTIKQMLETLKYLHDDQQVVHRDIKPDNFVLSEDGTLHLIDFNVSRKHLLGQKMMTQTGIPMFNAPEIYSGEPYDSKADVWSCGVILYMMLTGGEPPFVHDDISILIKIIKSEEPDYSELEVSNPDILDLLKLMLSKDPQERPSAGKCLKSIWLDTLEPVKKPQSSTGRKMSLFKNQAKGLQIQTRNWLFGSREISSGNQHQEEDDISETYSSGSSCFDTSPPKTALATGGTKMSGAGSMSDRMDSGIRPDNEESKCESLQEYKFKYTTPPVISTVKKLGGESTPQFHMAMVEEDSSGQEDTESKIIEL